MWNYYKWMENALEISIKGNWLTFKILTLKTFGELEISIKRNWLTFKILTLKIFYNVPILFQREWRVRLRHEFFRKYKKVSKYSTFFLHVQYYHKYMQICFGFRCIFTIQQLFSVKESIFAIQDSFQEFLVNTLFSHWISIIFRWQNIKFED